MIIVPFCQFPNSCLLMCSGVHVRYFSDNNGFILNPNYSCTFLFRKVPKESLRWKNRVPLQVCPGDELKLPGGMSSSSIVPPSNHWFKTG